MRIAIVNYVALLAEALRRIVIQEHEVIWVAHSGTQALQFCTENRPDLILMDLIMPEMDGVETTRLIMKIAPCAILIVTSSPEHNTSLVFRAMGAGALDVTATPVVAGNMTGDSALLKKIRRIGSLIAGDTRSNGQTVPLRARGGALVPTIQADMLVAIGASTGGPVALEKLLRSWTPPENCALVIVQHIDQAFTDSFAQWLGSKLDFPVSVIENGSPVTPGKILMAKTNDHLLLDECQHFRYRADPVDYPYRPSIDVFFHCIARYWDRPAIGVLLTGMGRDGAQGLLAMRQGGKSTLAQDEASSAVYGMPRAAAEINAAEQILPLEKIGLALARKTGSRMRLDTHEPAKQERCS